MDARGLKRPLVQLVDEDGNAFAILARCRRAMRDAGWPVWSIADFLEEARSGDYNHLLATVMEYTDDPGNGQEDE